MNGIGKKKSLDWDLNDWKWDGELFVATPLNATPADCWNKHLPQDASKGLLSNSVSPSSEGVDFGLVDRDKGEAEKRRRIALVDEVESCGGAESLSLKLGANSCTVVESDLAYGEGKNGRKGKSQGGNSTIPTCQVEGCNADLSDSRDYHRRHKVCEMHAKSSSAVVKNSIQRFCQQCSRFHLLEEFDEGKRSCRRRLAGHNRRRRKTNPDINVNGDSSIDKQTCGYLLIILLRILSNLQTANSERSRDQELLACLLRNLASLANTINPSNLSQFLRVSQEPQKLISNAGTSSEAIVTSVPNAPEQGSGSPFCSTVKKPCMDGIDPLQQANYIPSVAVTTVNATSKGRMASAELTVNEVRMMDFDLNSTYNDTQDFDGEKKPATPLGSGMGYPNCPSWAMQDPHQASSPQTSGNSDSTSNPTQSSSHGNAQCRTDRIIFKLFGKDPNDVPLVLRAQILKWLSSSPTDIESYIRPGCIILTIYIHQAESSWVQLCSDLTSNLNRLLYESSDEFWTMGWIFARVRNYAAFIYDGQVVLEVPLLTRHRNSWKVLSVSPIAVTCSTTVEFTVKGFNLAQATSKLLCSFDGKYLFQETRQALAEGSGRGSDQEQSQCLRFSCLIPDATGRGFIEFEDCGLSNGFFPFIVAEQDICSEICMLENAINVNSYDDYIQEKKETVNARNQALDFINELGWLLRRNHIISSCQDSKLSSNIFPLTRFRWLMSFAMKREWSAVVKKLLDILFNGAVDAGGQSLVDLVLSENLLHSAVQMKSEAIVQLLLRYVPDKTTNETDPDQLLFRPDMLGSSAITPLHIVASSDCAESLLDALTNDPNQVGTKAWKNIRDSTGFLLEISSK
ncbi:hypothetical protein Cni_G25200 [Canna indica]|uniref:SBP-type domain-containing protein n=1 Tax=Canna indica TaxID=4628 RepID=A0AAQ3KWM4_9LILI|nr:hypothetical protein Cni_G25200 [Canna indica]